MRVLNVLATPKAQFATAMAAFLAGCLALALAASWAAPLDSRAAAAAAGALAAAACASLIMASLAPIGFSLALAVLGAALGPSGAAALLALALPVAAFYRVRAEKRVAETLGFGVLGWGVGVALGGAEQASVGAFAGALGALGAALGALIALESPSPRRIVARRAAIGGGELAALRQELQRARQEADGLRAGLTARAADLGHELRTPISQIVSFADMARLPLFGPLSPKQEEYLDLIQVSGRNLLELVAWLMDIAQIEGGRYPFEPERFDLRAVLADVARLQAETAARKDVVLEAEAPDEPLTLLADPRAVRQILVNLAVNAVKFTPSGGRVTLRAGRANGAAVIEAEDSGPGIPEAERARLTERFARGVAAAGGADGVGLGLALVKGFADLHGGAVSFHDAPRLGGALVRVTLPALADKR